MNTPCSVFSARYILGVYFGVDVDVGAVFGSNVDFNAGTAAVRCVLVLLVTRGIIPAWNLEISREICRSGDAK